MIVKRPPSSTIELVRDRFIGSLQAVALMVFGSGVGCSLTDLDGLSVGSGSGGSAAESTGALVGSSASSGDPGGNGASTAGPGGNGGGGGVGNGVTSSADATSTGGGATSAGGNGGAGEGGSQGGGAPCVEGQICNLVDGFEDGADEWATFGICPTSDANGVLTVEALDTQQAGSYCGFYSVDVFDFRGGSFTVAVNETTPETFGVQTYINVNNAAENGGVGLVKAGTALEIGDRYITEYDPVVQRFWRIADRDGDIVFSVHSADLSADWVEILVVTDSTLTPESVRVAVGVGTFASNTDPGQGVFDCVNVPLEECPLP